MFKPIKGRIVVGPVRKKRSELADLISGITARNRSAEVASGSADANAGKNAGALRSRSRRCGWLECDPQAGHEQTGHRRPILPQDLPCAHHADMNSLPCNPRPTLFGQILLPFHLPCSVRLAQARGFV